MKGALKNAGLRSGNQLFSTLQKLERPKKASFGWHDRPCLFYPLPMLFQSFDAGLCVAAVIAGREHAAIRLALTFETAFA
jgi:hypothetical protein